MFKNILLMTKNKLEEKLSVAFKTKRVLSIT